MAAPVVGRAMIPRARKKCGGGTKKGGLPESRMEHARAARKHRERAALYRAHGHHGKARSHEAREKVHARLAFGSLAFGATPDATADQRKLWEKERKNGPSKDDGADDGGHALRFLSYYEFFARKHGLYVHQFPVAMAADVCEKTPKAVAPLERGATLFDGITEIDVENLLRSLYDNEPHFYEPEVDPKKDFTLKEPPRGPYGRGEFVFGLTDVLWMVNVGRGEKGGPFIPAQLRTAEAIAAYLNALVVETCTLTENAKRGESEWKVTVRMPESVKLRTGTGSDTRDVTVVYGAAKTFDAYCRKSSCPQRAIDVVPLVLCTDGARNVDRMYTTVSTRSSGGTTTIDGRAYEHVGCAREGRNAIVGAGEHLEPTDEVRQMWEGAANRQLIEPKQTNRRRFAELLDPRYQTPVAVNKETGASTQNAIQRALREEVGLDVAVGGRARMWVVGMHETRAMDVVARDPRYWPRRVFDAEGNLAPVLYGYARNCATAVTVAIMHLDAEDSKALRNVRLDPADKGEIKDVELCEWKELVPSFRDELDPRDPELKRRKQRKPAFGWAHQRMVEIVNESVQGIATEYATEQGLKMRAVTGKEMKGSLRYWRDAKPREQTTPECALM